MLSTVRICSKADEDLDLPGDDRVVGVDVDYTEDAVDDFFAFLSHKMDFLLLL